MHVPDSLQTGVDVVGVEVDLLPQLRLFSPVLLDSHPVEDVVHDVVVVLADTSLLFYQVLVPAH